MSDAIEHAKLLAFAWDSETIETFGQCGQAAYADIRPLARGFNALVDEHEQRDRKLARYENEAPRWLVDKIGRAE